MRKLASIQQVTKVYPIDGADNIEVVQILGWHCVTKKGEFKPKDKVVYLEIDSLVNTDNPNFEFLKKNARQDGKARIKTIKLRGQVSQGLALPLSVLPEKNTTPILRWFKKWQVDDDVTEILGIEKYEADEWNRDSGPKARLGGQTKGGLPSFVVKTDETRVQNLQWLLDKYKGQLFYVTEKLDGSSMTVYMKDGEFGVCSRNLELKPDSKNAFWARAIADDLEHKLRNLQQYGGHYVIQGELIGPGIQGNKYKLTETEFHVFNVYNIKEDKYLCYEAFKHFCSDLGLKHVPDLGVQNLDNNIDNLVEQSRGKSELNKYADREGLVFRPLDDKYERKIGRVTFKSINPEFLLKEK